MPGAGNFLHDGRHSVWLGWPARWLAVLCAVAVTVGGLHLVQPVPSRQADQVARTVSAAQGFADAAVAAFAKSAVGSDLSVSPEQRRAGLPTEPVAGLTAQTPAGPVQVVLPGGLGNAQHTAGGQVVYPNAGAGFDLLAENTATGTRTVARISDPGGPRMVTTFVRTPADTVMLAHTNGYLTINRATPTAETIGMFSPAETRDATGRLVLSSYVVKQLAPQLYVLAEVIDPRPDTTWPVYVDPPLHLTGPGGMPVGLFDSFTNTVSSLADTATSAVKTAASATVSGAKAVGGFVKDNPLESALLVGGVALAVTGVGGPAGAAMIASATVNISSAAVDIAAAAMPDNQALGIASTVLGAASMVTPQGAAKKAVTEGAELAVEQLAKHTDDIIDVAKTTPTPPAQLVDEITATNPSPPVTPGVSPKAPNAPPHELPATPLRSDLPHTGQTPSSNVKEFQPETMDPGCKLDCGYTTKSPAAVYNEVEMPGHTQHKFETVPGQLTHEFPERIPQNRRDNLRGVESKGSDGLHRDESPPASTQESRNGRSSVRHLDELESMKERKLLSALSRRYKLKGGDPQEFVYRGTDGKTRCPQCALQRYNDQHQRRASPQAQRAEQHLSTQEATNQHRNTARNTARENNQAGGQGRNSGSKAQSSKKSDNRKNDKKKNKKSKKNHKKPSGK